MAHVETLAALCRASQQLDLLEEFKLVGNMVGLAIYNSVILDVTFPIVLYKCVHNLINSASTLCLEGACMSIMHCLDTVTGCALPRY